MTFTGRRARWLGAGTETHKARRGAGRRQRQRHYQAVELPCGGQVSVNDVVETDKERRLAQVLCMWEDVSSGSRRFRARWLLRPADLPTKTSPRLRLQSDRRHRSTDFSISSSSSSGSTVTTAASTTELSSSTGESFGTLQEGGQRDDDEHDGVDEIFLTSRTQDLDLSSMKRLVVLSLPATMDVTPGMKTEAAQTNQTGPRLSHAFDYRTRELIPLEGTHPILARARSRRAESIELVSRAAADTTGDGSSRPAVVQNIGWMPLKRSWATASAGSGVALKSPPAPAPAPAPRLAASASSGPVESSIERLVASAMEKGSGGTVDSNQQAAVDDDPARMASSAPDEPASERPEAPVMDKAGGDTVDSNRYRHAEDDDLAGMFDVGEARHDGNVRGSPSSASIVSEKDRQEPWRATPNGPAQGDHANVVVEDTRSADVEALSRLPAPTVDDTQQEKGPVTVSAQRMGSPVPLPASGAASPTVVHSLLGTIPPSHSHSGSKVATRFSTRITRGLGVGASPVLGPSSLSRLPTHSSSADATPPKPGSAKRKRATRRAMRQNTVAEETRASELTETPCRAISVGDDYQASIPDMLSASGGPTEASAEGAGDQERAELVWESIRDWDHRSRGILAGYLQAASAVARKNQGRPGIAVRVRSSRGNHLSDESIMMEGSRKEDDHAGWALTTDRDCDDPDIVDVARSEQSSMQVSLAAIQAVQCEEEALKALRETGCSLDHFEPALNTFSRRTAQKNEPSWTLDQVKMLEDYVEESLQKITNRNNRNMRHMVRPGVKLDREDFVDVAAMGKSVPGKTPAQVVDFFYRYLAAARPPSGDRLREATVAQHRKSVSSAGSGRRSPPSIRPGGPATHRSAGGNLNNIGVVTASQEHAAVTADQVLFSPREVGKGAHGAPSSQRLAHSEVALAQQYPTEPQELQTYDSDNNYDGHLTAGAKRSVLPPRPVVDELPRQVTWEDEVPPAPKDEDDCTAQQWPKRPRDLRPTQPGALREASPADHAARDERQRRIDVSKGGGEDRVIGCWGRSNCLSAQPVWPDDDDEFGFMYPCWRLLGRTSDDLDKDQLEYMRGLILTHVRKPMYREELLARARSCLEELPHVWVSFVDTFDRLDEARTVPLYGRDHCTPSTRWAAATPASLAVPPYCTTPPAAPSNSNSMPAVAAYPDIPQTLPWTSTPLLGACPPSMQHVPCGVKTLREQPPSDIPRRPSRWAPRYDTNGRLLAPAREAFGEDGLGRG